MVRRFVLLALLRLSSALFETCDETFQLDTDASVTISSGSTLNARNVSSCRYTLVAPANYIVDVTCRLEIDQPESQQCPLKRFFVSVDGMKDLRGADYFCNRIGSRRKVRRRSVMNRLVLAYATKEAYVGDEKFVCVARRVEVSCDCGWAKRARIFNGEDAQIHEFPSMIALVALSINRVFCGGVIISERWGLTSAHCFNEGIYADLGNVAAFVGEHDLRVNDETIYTESYELEKYVKHEKYLRHSNTQDFDIALIKTVKPIAFNLGVGPACLPWLFAENAFDHNYVTVAGWGLLNFFGGPADILQKVSLQVLPAKLCQDSKVNSAKMCTFEDGKDSCISDSGGPLFFTKGRQFAVGLVSYGVGCGSKVPSVNSRITSYLTWILEKSEGESFCRK